MEINTNTETKDGLPQQSVEKPPSVVDESKQKCEGISKKKRRRGKAKRKVMKPYSKTPWQEGRKNDKNKRNNRFRKIVLAKTHAPFNNNQFLMEIHKPEPENNFHLARTPSARTRDSSFSVDSEDNYFYSLPEDEEEYLTKEFSSVYEDAQSERLSNMSKDDLIQEYLLLEAKYDNLVKRAERKQRFNEDDKESDITEKDISVNDKDSMITEKDTSVESGVTDEPSVSELLQRMKEQEEQIRELQIANEKLILENQHLRQSSQCTSSEDSESDSSSTSMSSSSCSSRSASPVNESRNVNSEPQVNNHVNNLQNGEIHEIELDSHLVNGFHDSGDQ